MRIELCALGGRILSWKKDAVMRVRRLGGRMMVIGMLGGVCLVGLANQSMAEESTKNGTQAEEKVEPETIRLTVHPKGAPTPALKIRLVPDAAEQLHGNSAIYYLKAMGFFEQDYVRDRLREVIKKASEEAKSTNREASEFPPYSYLELRPSDYPKEEVREYLKLLSFQVPILREARRYRDFSMDRNVHLSENPMGYVLSEIQSLRELARNQRIRCRLAIAEGRIDDAIEVIGQQVSMSRHISMDDFLVSYLVGSAVLREALDDALVLLEHSECPNLYWAFSQLPDPLMNMEACLSMELQFVFLQIPRLREVDLDPRGEEYWKEFIVEFAERTREIDEYNNHNERPIVSRELGENRVASILKEIAANAEKAKEYLIERAILSRERSDGYSDAHLVFLAMKNLVEVSRDELFKWLRLPYGDAREGYIRVNEEMNQIQERFGWFTGIPQGLLPPFYAFHESVTRSKQRLALVQAIEAIRMAGAENEGKLPESLESVPVPVPLDPFTGKAFSYRVEGDVATLASEFPLRMPLSVEIRFAN